MATRRKVNYVFNQDILPKSTEIRVITHEEILAIGNQIFKNTNEKNNEIFQMRLSKETQQLIDKLRMEFENELQTLRHKNDDEIERLKRQYLKMQDDALKTEASRVKSILNKQTKTLIANTESKGQKKLEEALIKARQDFDLEKQNEIEKTIVEQKKLRDIQIEEVKETHKQQMDILNNKWENKLKIEIQKENKLLQSEFENERNKIAEHYKTLMSAELAQVTRKHSEEVEQLENIIKKSEEHNSKLKGDIEKLKSKVNEKIECIETVLDSFRTFIETSPGFYEGQADFLLDDLIPLKSLEKINF